MSPGGPQHWNFRVYDATGAFITALRRAVRFGIRVSGAEQLPPRPTLFAANHFTRLETLLIPYILYRQTGRPVRSLATHTLFRGLMGRYLRSVGVMSVRDPRRNRSIVSDLITRRSDWIIYPEGGLIKNKKVVDDAGRLWLTHPRRTGPPHTGAAMLALKAEIARRRFLRACGQGDERRLEYYRDAFGLVRPADVDPGPTVIVPVTLTFHPIRPGSNAIERLARRWTPGLDERVAEELCVEGSLLLGRGTLAAHFGEPIEVAEYLDAPTSLARRIVGLFSESRHSDLLLKRQAMRLTEDVMRRVYENVEIGADRLLCAALRHLDRDRVLAARLHRRLYLAALELREAPGVRLDETLCGDLTALLDGRSIPALDDALAFAERQGVVRRENEHYLLDRAAITRAVDFNRIRLEATTQVLANELEGNRLAAELVARSVNAHPETARRRVATLLREHHLSSYRRDYETWFHPDDSKPVAIGEPLLLTVRRPRAGVVLAHGYLSSPEQVRPLAEHLCSAGCCVYAVRLPGHGTSPEQLNAVTWRQWLQAVLHAHAVMEAHAESVIVGGFSLGGILALLCAARRGERVRGAFAINAPARLRDRRAPFVPAVVHAHGTLRRLGLASGHARRRGHRSETPEFNYGRDYLHGVRELRRAVSAARCDLGLVTAPALIVQSDADPIVAPVSGRVLLDGLGASTKRLIELPSERHYVLRGPEQGLVFAAITRFVDECGRTNSIAAGASSP